MLTMSLTKLKTKKLKGNASRYKKKEEQRMELPGCWLVDQRNRDGKWEREKETEIETQKEKE